MEAGKLNCPVVNASTEEVTVAPSGDDTEPLVRLYVEPTGRCNLDCRMCIRSNQLVEEEHMSWEVFELLISQIKGYPHLESVVFIGYGEPLFHPRILDMLRALKDLGLRTELVTNGTLLEGDLAHRLTDGRLDRLVVSLDGASPEIYGEIRLGAALSHVLQNLKAFYELRGGYCPSILMSVPLDSLGPPEVDIEFVAMRRNIMELTDLRYLASHVGVSSIIVTNVLPYTDEMTSETLYSSSALSWRLYQNGSRESEIRLPLMDLTGEALPLVHDLLRSEARLRIVDTQLNAEPIYCRFIGGNAAMVAWDGGMSPCMALIRSYPCYVLGKPKRIQRYRVGDIRERDLLEIWRDPEYVGFRNRVREFDFAPCLVCGGCQLSESNEEDCIGSPFPTCGDCLWAAGIIQCP